MASANIISQPAPGYVHLVLYEQQHEPFYLEMPIPIITSVCSSPCKYLRYLGWCVLGVEGELQDGQRHQVDLNGNLVDQGVYYYILPVAQQDVLLHAVDLEVIKKRSQVSSQSTERGNAFRDELVRRDGNQCVWTGFPGGVAMHIIPCSKGDKWLELIIANRPHGDEQNLDTLSINDIRNGIMGVSTLYDQFDSRAVVVLKTPNPILETTDVPDRSIRYYIPPNASYPIYQRYTLQWIGSNAYEHPVIFHTFPNNTDAVFVSFESGPSNLLLHYNYGVAAVKNWGRNHAVLNNHPGLPRPPPFDPVHMDPTRSVGDRAKTIAKLTKARAEGAQPQHADNGGSELSEAAIDSEPPVWDEDDVMLFFWGNSKPAMKRYAKKAQERKENIDEWRAGVVV